MSYIKRIGLALILFQCTTIVGAQAPGSFAISGGTDHTVQVASGTTVSNIAESLYIGPGQYIIDGVWEVYAKNIWISPDAIIQGTGSMIFENPSLAGGISGSTFIDGNESSHAINVNVQLQNENGMVLKQMNAIPELTGTPSLWNDDTISSSLYIGKDVSLAVDGGNVVLDAGHKGDLILDADATLSNYDAQRMVVTNNSVVSHVVKQNFPGAFEFPVGITAGDYTPAIITNSTAQDIYLSVTDYAGSTAEVEAPAEGIDRAWHIYGSIGDSAGIELRHNTITNGAAYSDALAFITQYEGGNLWSTSATSDYLSPGLHSNLNMGIASVAGDNSSWFSKVSDASTPLPLKLISFTAEADECKADIKWTTATEGDCTHFILEHGVDGVLFNEIATINVQGKQSGDYNYVDANAVSGKNFYRLKMVSKDGKTVSSDIIVAVLDCNDRHILLFPNPTKGIITMNGLKGTEHIQVIDEFGRQLMESDATSDIIHLDLSRFAAAVYHVTVTDAINTQTFKVIKGD